MQVRVLSHWKERHPGGGKEGLGQARWAWGGRKLLVETPSHLFAVRGLEGCRRASLKKEDGSRNKEGGRQETSREDGFSLKL